MCQVGRSSIWVISAMFALIAVSVVEAAVFVNITYVKRAVRIGAVCLDGSPPAYHLDRGFGRGVNNWLVQIEGGGWCHNVTNCISRMKTRLGSSKFMQKQIPFSGILNRQAKNNPNFYNWNRVKVRYCDGSSFTGDVEKVDRTNLHFRGAKVFDAVMKDLLDIGMKNAQNAILSGCSAGGLSTILHCDLFRAKLPQTTRVKCISDAGFFLNATDVSGGHAFENYFNQVVATHGSKRNLPVACTSKIDPHLCFFPQNAAKYVQTPLFILNSAYDSWQIRHALAPPEADPKGAWNQCKVNFNKCSRAQLATIKNFRKEFAIAMLKLGRSPTRGIFVDSCYLHCQTEQQALWLSTDSPKVQNVTISKAVGDWFFDRKSSSKFDCPYPCNPTCHNMFSITQQKQVPFSLPNLHMTLAI